MATQLSTSRRPVALATALFAVSLAVFSAAFYVFDGVSLVEDFVPTELFASLLGGTPPSAPASAPSTDTAAPGELDLPPGMPDEFALRLWQEQVDSQATITRLANGEVKSLKINDVTVRGDEAELACTITFSDGVSADGIIGLRRFGDTWYVAFARADRGGGSIAPKAQVPALDDIDAQVLSTIIAQNRKYHANSQEYVDGHVKSVAIQEVQKGQSTATLHVKMNEDHETGYADVVLIKTERDGEELWFIAKFDKTRSEPLKK